MKENKGITLVALIITIIVLLILAVVAIASVNGDGIITHAKNARNDYQTAQNTENIVLGNYLTDLNNANTEIEEADYYVFSQDGNSFVVKKVNGFLVNKMYVISGNNVTLDSQYILNNTAYALTPMINRNYILEHTAYTCNSNGSWVEIPMGTQVTSYFEGEPINTRGFDNNVEEYFFEYDGKLYCHVSSGLGEFVLDEDFDSSIIK